MKGQMPNMRFVWWNLLRTLLQVRQFVKQSVDSGGFGLVLGPKGNSRDSSGLEPTKGNMHVSTNPPWKQQSNRQTMSKHGWNWLSIDSLNIWDILPKLFLKFLCLCVSLFLYISYVLDEWIWYHWYVVFGYSRPLCQLHETGCQSRLSIFREVWRITGIHGASCEIHL